MIMLGLRRSELMNYLHKAVNMKTLTSLVRI